MTTYTTRIVKVAKDRGQRTPRLGSMQFWLKLVISLGLLAALTILVVLISQLASARASQSLHNTDVTLVPAAVVSSHAQADLLRMSADLQSYLVIGQPANRDSYARSAAAVATDLATLNGFSSEFGAVDKQHLNDLKLAFDRWNGLQDRLLASHDNLATFQNEAAPLIGQMLGILDQISVDQQTAAHSALAQGANELSNARWAMLFAAVVAILFAAAMFFYLRDSIDGPIGRLTGVAERVRAGDLSAQAVVESQDQIGRLADTFNRMTRQMRRTLFQTRREKKRADDLLTVVIPLGLQLSAEKDFSRLLETIVVQAQSFSHATGGVLYLRNTSGKLQPIVVRDDAVGLALGGTTGQPITYEAIPLDDPLYSLTVRTAWFGTTVNVPDAVPSGDLNYVSPAFVDNPYENNTSFLAIPLRPSQGQVMGVLQLTGAQDPDTHQIVPFDSHLQQMMDSFSLLAAGALEAYLREQGLKDQIQQLRIEIDEVKRQQQVKEIVESEAFSDLQAKARLARARNARSGQKPPQAGDDPTKNDDPEQRG
jgi:HAMP domain-containing protein/GAF domain-containing protein